MRRFILVFCTLVFCGVAIAHASVPSKLPCQTKSAAAAVRAVEGEKKGAEALATAQDRAVANYECNLSRMAAAAKAVAEKAAEQAEKAAKALARAQDRVVAHYKRSLGMVLNRIEKLACFTGVQDRHARIGVQLVNGKVDYFAYYSKWKPRTCSIAVERDGGGARWEDHGSTSKVTLNEGKGVLLISRQKGSYRFIFRGVDRMRFCGMDGKINGSLTVTRGRSTCVVKGVMDGQQG